MKLLNWIFKYWGLMLVPIPVQVDTTELDKLATVFVAQLNEERFKDTSGLYKRNQVLRMLMNHFPDTRERDLVWAIENAVRR